jgi:polyferredoxin
MALIKKPFLTRTFVQYLFFAMVIYIGIVFTLFVSLIEKGLLPGFERPPGVEAFLPISALVSLKYYLFTGIINRIHPSALVLFLMICLTALFAKKGFCSWVCPIGLLSETLSKPHFLIFKNGISMPGWLDRILRSLKYILAGFFIWSVFYAMPMGVVEQFIHSPYNRFADIKMLKFFTEISSTGITVILILLILSVVIRNFWCRYLCPYGALVGLIGFFSVGKIRRDDSHCTHCGRCERACQGQIKIREKDFVQSLECTACLECIKTCPERDAIGFSLFQGKIPLNQKTLGLSFILLFSFGISIAKLSGNWQNKITNDEYLHYGIRSSVSFNSDGQIDPEKMEKMMSMMKNMEARKSPMTESFKQKDEDHAHTR